MEVEIREVVISSEALSSLENIYLYGCETFSETSAALFVDKLLVKIKALSINFYHHPECRYLSTKSKQYRNLRYGSYLVIYKITPARIEVLNIIHASRSITAIKSVKKINIK